jgi:hypothetical protein
MLERVLGCALTLGLVGCTASVECGDGGACPTADEKPRAADVNLFFGTDRWAAYYAESSDEIVTLAVAKGQIVIEPGSMTLRRLRVALGPFQYDTNVDPIDVSELTFSLEAPVKLPPDPVSTAWYSVPAGSTVQTCAVVGGVRQHGAVALREPLTVRYYGTESLTLDAVLPLRLELPAGDRCEMRRAEVLVFMRAEPKDRPGNTFSCMSAEGYFQICTTPTERGDEPVPVEIR